MIVLKLPDMLLHVWTLRALQIACVQDYSSLEVNDDLVHAERLVISGTFHQAEGNSLHGFGGNMVETVEVNGQVITRFCLGYTICQLRGDARV